MKSMMKGDHLDNEDHDKKMEEELTKGSSLASKVMEDLFKRQKAQINDIDAKKQKEQDELLKQRQTQHDKEFEKAVLNFVKTSANQKVSESQPSLPVQEKKGFSAAIG